jgi:ADP-ribose pyrophosphatase
MEIEISDRRVECVLSPWVTLVTHNVRFPGSLAEKEFHSFKQVDYVSMLAVTTDARIPLVRQYRPALEQFTLELPSGLLEPGEEPAEAASRELMEETGLVAGPTVMKIGHFVVDSGRLENRLWAFFTNSVSPQQQTGWQPDPQVECFLVSKNELKELILKGQFEHGPHLAVLGQAMAHGCFSF